MTYGLTLDGFTSRYFIHRALRYRYLLCLGCLRESERQGNQLLYLFPKEDEVPGH